MGKNKNNEYADGFSGKIGRNLVFRQGKGDQTIIARKPRKSLNPPHESRLETQRAFQRGALYANQVNANPEKKAMYAAAAKGMQTAFNLAMRDAIKPPKVSKIDASLYNGQVGDPLIIVALDDFKVESVVVSIHAPNGDLIEEGNAIVPELSIDWVYTVTTANAQLAGCKITAVATDIPGNKGSLEITL
ncbi:MAG: hypothetical protein J7497_02375 [Chitinophagaceae bacterium]|nr:hypothetical protein [Chitinophagaceae bacterium]